ncbi:hypothetical protein CDCA_CDCA13G3566 [Cyanidium caldarium]|uniref:Uncharacterized protein n=1 Tax=Cyanidium caldarium TaxID=2771 RepID=A0AAV9IZI6_CYACA|nr:hypothetical protein CDCA_CDCA13G3566 [Cyanidium caldarium]
MTVGFVGAGAGLRRSRIGSGNVRAVRDTKTTRSGHLLRRKFCGQRPTTVPQPTRPIARRPLQLQCEHTPRPPNIKWSTWGTAVYAMAYAAAVLGLVWRGVYVGYVADRGLAWAMRAACWAMAPLLADLGVAARRDWIDKTPLTINMSFEDRGVLPYRALLALVVALELLGAALIVLRPPFANVTPPHSIGYGIWLICVGQIEYLFLSPFRDSQTLPLVLANAFAGLAGIVVVRESIHPYGMPSTYAIQRFMLCFCVAITTLYLVSKYVIPRLRRRAPP